MRAYNARICIRRGQLKVKVSLYNEKGRLVSDEELEGIELVVLDGETLIALNSLSNEVLCINARYQCAPKKEVRGSVLRLSRC